ncbi:two-component system sensor histidine kinase/response regulator [Xaviernesmea oryzae]|uniref:Two-component system sensor histidine kinase/response regulator n=1 Tax=Xaviernesmea oryzae TaxID=464029 RepID=A0A1Q9B1A9_9HYPH|nr:response regulator [Xaviernesmea oryzae]OLP61798.1 two-component system sensor histidine kinase/response regulator [Xaviernesmea oryzae]SEL76986.1 two-component system, chemotaxis family, response regulator CheY [Xaviernesmea oryzae]
MMKPILLVDDSATMLASLTSILGKAGLAFVTAPDGQSAIDKVMGGLAPALVITDYHMPGMHGVDLIAKLRRLPATRFTPMLVLTTDSQQDKRSAAKAAGATGWLVKPVEPPALLQVVRQLVSQAA